jgi:H+-transporting ATPase
MTALSLPLIAGILCAAVVLAVVLDSAKLVLFRSLAVT